MSDDTAHKTDDRALTALQLACTDLAAARAHTIAALPHLSSARATRAAQLREKISDAMAWAQRLAFIVEADLRYEESNQ